MPFGVLRIRYAGSTQRVCPAWLCAVGAESHALALPREAGKTNKIKVLRNRLGKKMPSLFCKGFQERYPNGPVPNRADINEQRGEPRS